MKYKTGIKRVIPMLLAISIVLSDFAGLTNNAFAKEDSNKVDMNFVSDYDAETNTEIIRANAFALQDNVTVTGITLPDGTFEEDTEVQYTVNKNSKYDFIVHYKENIEVETPTEAPPLVEGETSAEEKPSTEGETSAEEKPSTEGEASAEEKPSTEGETSAEEKPSTEGETSAEEKPSTEGGTSAEEKPSTEGGTSAEEKPSTEGETSAEEKPSTEGETSGEGESAVGSVSPADGADLTSGDKTTLGIIPEVYAYTDEVTLRDLTIPKSISTEGSKRFTFTAKLITKDNQPKVSIEFTSEREVEREEENITVTATELSDEFSITGIKMPDGNMVEGNTAEFRATEPGEYLFETIYKKAEPEYGVLSLPSATYSEAASFTVAPFVATEEKYFVFNPDTQTIVAYTSSPDAPKNITIPNQIAGVDVLHVGDNAFSGQQLTSLVLNDNLQTIGENAFRGNSGIIGELVIPDNVSSIGAYAFDGCRGVTGFVLPDGLTGLGAGTFAGCTGLTDITIPAGVTIIPDALFYGNTKLSNINILGDVTSIGEFAFYRNAAPDLTLPGTVTSIGASAFKEMNKLTQITIPQSVTRIGDFAFEGCPELESIYITEKPAGSITGEPWSSTAAVYWKDVSVIDGWLFDSTTGMISKYLGTETDVIMPPGFEIGGITYPVTGFTQATFSGNNKIQKVKISEVITEIPTAAFENCSGLTDVELPGSITEIGARAFKKCSKLTNINIPDSVTVLPEGIFDGCSSLVNFSIPDTVISIGKNAFAACTQLNTIVIGSGITEIPDNAFLECINLQNIELPNSITSIGKDAFKSCNALESITIPESVVSIAPGAFLNCLRLEEINIPTKVAGSIPGAPWGSKAVVNWSDVVKSGDWVFNPGTKTITKYLGTTPNVVLPASFNVGGVDYAVTAFEESTFRENTNIKSVSIHGGITDIPERAFLNCTSLTNVTIQEGVQNIKERAFQGCASLADIQIPDTVRSISSDVFRECKSLESIVLPEGVTEIAFGLFWGCEKLKNVNLPESLTRIGGEAFVNCSELTNITIPNNVTDISYLAFSGCSKLKSIIISTDINNIEGDAFKQTPALERIFILRVRDAAPTSLTGKQPWGANSSVRVQYLGEFVRFEHNLTPVTGEYAKNINIKASIDKDGALISRIILPKGEVIEVGTPKWPSTAETYPYKVTANGDYTFRGVDLSLSEVEYTVTVQDIGKPTLTASDALIDLDNTLSITEDELLNRINAKATTVELGENFVGGTIEIQNNGLANVQALSKHGDKTNVTIIATSPTGLEATTTVTVEATSIRTVTFDTNGLAPVPPIQNVATGEKVSKPADPTRVGYTFTGWYRETTLNTVWDFSADVVGKTSMTLYAGWEINKYEVKFIDKDGTEIQKKMLDYGTPITAPADPIRVGHTFSGWTPSVDAAVPAKNVTYTATYTINKYTITVTTSGRGRVSPNGTAMIEYGASKEYEIIPGKDYRVADVEVNGVSVGVGVGKTYIFTDVTEDQWLNVIFKRELAPSSGTGTRYYTLNFATNGGSVIPSKKVKENQTIRLTREPTKDGYEFEGWYSDRDFNEEVTSVYMDRNKNVYAKWTEEINPPVPPVNPPVPPVNPPVPPVKPPVSPVNPPVLPVKQGVDIIVTPEGNIAGVIGDDKSGFGITANNSGNRDVAQPGNGKNGGRNCIRHWILLVLAMIMFIITMVKRKRNKKELDELLNRGREVV